MITDANLDISIIIFEEIRKFLGKNTGVKLLALGYTDIILSEESLARIQSRIVVNGDAVFTILADAQGKRFVKFDPVSFYSLFGFETTFIDYFDPAPQALKIDLNQPIDPEFHQAFDAVIDGGTAEHCFNIAQVMANMSLCVRVGGILSQGNPLFSMNHGFYNFSPVFYEKFYEKNGFTLLNAWTLQNTSSGLMLWGGFPASSHEALMLGERGGDYFVNTFARKDTHVEPVLWPSQY
ncbi:hypothetical protein [Phaeospirillum tilakii]|uniref:Methyltransferase domain-containing protein n=1 Tax=Phaeospirillum tilakii TaxID=741673 RepID=A0ABW5CAE4_9PROT